MSLQYSGVVVIELTCMCKVTVVVCVSAQESTCDTATITILTAMIDLRGVVLY